MTDGRVQAIWISCTLSTATLYIRPKWWQFFRSIWYRLSKFSLAQANSRPCSPNTVWYYSGWYQRQLSERTHHWFRASYWLSASMRKRVSWKQPPFIDMYFWSHQWMYPWCYPFLVELTWVSTVACSNQTHLASSVPYLWFIVSSIKFIFRVNSGHIVSVPANQLRLSNQYEFGHCRFPANCQYFQPNSSISKHWLIFKHWFVKSMITNERVGVYRRDIDQDSESLTIPHHQTPSNDLLDAVA